MKHTCWFKSYRWIILLVLAPLISWWAYRPIRVLTPTLNGFTRIDDTIYIDDLKQSNQALQLYKEAVEYVQSRLGTFDQEPNVIFCTSEDSFASFGLDAQAAMTFGKTAVVIAPRGWERHYVRHELIHVLQAQRLGLIRFHRQPTWFIEGMAYYMSNDPRPTLSPPWQGYRDRFRDWHTRLGNTELWEAAKNLQDGG